VTDPHYLAPVAKLDARSLLSALNAQENLGLTFLDMAPGGEVGAAYVQWPDGHEGVLTVGAKPADEVRTTAAVLEKVRSRGIPAPRYEVVTDVGGAVALVQERLPGTLPTRLTRELGQQILEILEQFQDVLAGHDEIPIPDLYLRHSGPGFCIHETLASHSARTRAVLRWVRDTGRRRHARMRGDDLVHLDLHAHNVLVDAGGRITGIVDWDGIGRGDRRFALATLRFAALGQRADADTTAWLDKVLDESLDPETLRAYWASMSLREVDWAIRHHPEQVDDVLDLAESRMD
jgi:aminoglycoside phosphotransferase (APT) family kinase protein